MKLFSGSVQKGTKVEFLHTGKKIDVIEVGCFSPEYTALKEISAGEIGYIVTGLRTIHDAQVGDTIFSGDAAHKTPIE